MCRVLDTDKPWQCDGENYSVRWSVGKIQEDTEEDSFIPYTGTDETAFWKSEGNKLYIDGARFAKAYQELEEGWHFVIRTERSRLYSRCE